MRPDTRYKRFVKWLVSRIHGDAAFSWRNSFARKVGRALVRFGK